MLPQAGAGTVQETDVYSAVQRCEEKQSPAGVGVTHLARGAMDTQTSFLEESEKAGGCRGKKMENGVVAEGSACAKAGGRKEMDRQEIASNLVES